MLRQNKQEELQYVEKPVSIKDEEIDLSRLFSDLWEKKWLIVGGALAGAVLAVILAFILPAKYTGTGTLIIKQGQNSNPLSNFTSSNGGLAGVLLGSGSGSNIQNEIEILESRTLAERMADHLLQNPLMANGHMYPVLWEEWPVDSVVTDKRTIAGRLMEQIEYTLTDKTTIIEVANDSPSPYEARNLTNLAMQTYQDLSLEQSRDLTGTTAEYLVDQQTEYRDSLNQSEIALRNYMEGNDVVELQAQTQQEIQQYAEMTGKRYEARVQLKAANASIEEYQERLNEIKPGLADKLADAIGTTIQNLQFQISELETERALIYARNPGLEGSNEVPPKVVRINNQLHELQQRVRNQTERLLQTNDEYLGLLAENSSSVISTISNYSQKLIELRVEQLQYQARIEALNEQINEKNRFLENVPENTLQMARLKRQVEVQQELYLLVTKQLAQARFQAKSEMASSRVLDTAILPLHPSFPQYWLFLAGGLLLGGFLSLAFVLIRVLLDDTINDAYFLKQNGYRVFEIDGDGHIGRYALFAEHLISTVQKSGNNIHAFFPIGKTSHSVQDFVRSIMTLIEAKGFDTARIVGTEDPSTSQENSGANILRFDDASNANQMERLILQKAHEVDVTFAHVNEVEYIDNFLSLARIAGSTWIIAEAGFTNLSAVTRLEEKIMDVDGSLKGVILIHKP